MYHRLCLHHIRNEPYATRQARVREAEEWCGEQFGPCETRHRDGSWFVHQQWFFFKRMAEAALFKLRWL